MGVSTRRMSADEIRPFAHYICNLNESKKSGIQKITQSPRLRMVPHQLDNIQNTGWILGTNLQVAMIDLDHDHNMV